MELFYKVLILMIVSQSSKADSVNLLKPTAIESFEQNAGTQSDILNEKYSRFVAPDNAIIDSNINKELGEESKSSSVKPLSVGSKLFYSSPPNGNIMKILFPRKKFSDKLSLLKNRLHPDDGAKIFSHDRKPIKRMTEEKEKAEAVTTSSLIQSDVTEALVGNPPEATTENAQSTEQTKVSNGATKKIEASEEPAVGSPQVQLAADVESAIDLNVASVHQMIGETEEEKVKEATAAYDEPKVGSAQSADVQSETEKLNESEKVAMSSVLENAATDSTNSEDKKETEEAVVGAAQIQATEATVAATEFIGIIETSTSFPPPEMQIGTTMSSELIGSVQDEVKQESATQSQQPSMSIGNEPNAESNQSTQSSVEPRENEEKVEGVENGPTVGSAQEVQSEAEESEAEAAIPYDEEMVESVHLVTEPTVAQTSKSVESNSEIKSEALQCDTYLGVAHLDAELPEDKRRVIVGSSQSSSNSGYAGDNDNDDDDTENANGADASSAVARAVSRAQARARSRARARARAQSAIAAGIRSAAEASRSATAGSQSSSSSDAGSVDAASSDAASSDAASSDAASSDAADSASSSNSGYSRSGAQSRSNSASSNSRASSSRQNSRSSSSSDAATRQQNEEDVAVGPLLARMFAFPLLGPRLFLLHKKLYKLNKLKHPFLSMHMPFLAQKALVKREAQFSFVTPSSIGRPNNINRRKTLIERLQEETSMERAERRHHALERMMHVATIAGHVDGFLTKRLKSSVRKLHKLLNSDES